MNTNIKSGYNNGALKVYGQKEERHIKNLLVFEIYLVRPLK
ncbi:5258_t:CDS:2 [Diversispora eburnea]|uniref:5258_t:CDS:1 n=1 Tax=Diversispora eburnea TaxID=1213867 RepID=A0A9N8ZHN1_9GLOM|nr:5258_t:CDS:2 [Diversispora eburnea]